MRGRPKKVKCNIFTFMAGGEAAVAADVNVRNSCSHPAQALSPVQSTAEGESSRHPPGPAKYCHGQRSRNQLTHFNLIRTHVLSQDIISATFTKEKMIYIYICIYIDIFFFFWPHNSHLADYINVLPCFHWWPAALLTSIYRLASFAGSPANEQPPPLRLILPNHTNECKRGLGARSSILAQHIFNFFSGTSVSDVHQTSQQLLNRLLLDLEQECLD